MKNAEDRCNCPDCRLHKLADCINNKCDCCDLEDVFIVISRQRVSDVLLA